MTTGKIDDVFEIIIRDTPETVWKAITDSKLTQKYYFHTRVESDWAVKSSINYYDQDGDLSSGGDILEIKPGSYLKSTYKPAWLGPDSVPSVVSWDIQSLKPALTLLKLTHSEVDAETIGQMHSGWVYILSNLKSVLETGEPLPELFG
jgi:uncharacterized protein YndB with AHSA1/START domain